MSRTARRRWVAEFQGEIDGIVLGSTGPVFVHGYDPPAGGKWIDNVIPGKLAALDRHTGDVLWTSPCEVGYGRGFGSGLGHEEDVVVLGPSLKGHRIARMDRSTGELIAAREIDPFDQALVEGDMCVTVTPGRIAGIMTSAMLEVWAHSRDGERYHLVGREGSRVFAVFSNAALRRQGVLCLDVESGEPTGHFLEPEFPVIHNMVVGGGLAILLVGDRAPNSRATGSEELTLAAYSTQGGAEAVPLWRETVANESHDELPDVSISLDSGKLYIARGVTLEVRDGLTGRSLGELTMPGLDERVAWQVSQGAGLLAEETRASVFELPA
jgi:hypothetical protein